MDAGWRNVGHRNCKYNIIGPGGLRAPCVLACDMRSDHFSLCISFYNTSKCPISLECPSHISQAFITEKADAKYEESWYGFTVDIIEEEEDCKDGTNKPGKVAKGDTTFNFSCHPLSLCCPHCKKYTDTLHPTWLATVYTFHCHWVDIILCNYVV